MNLNQELTIRPAPYLNEFQYENIFDTFVQKNAIVPLSITEVILLLVASHSFRIACSCFI